MMMNTGQYYTIEAVYYEYSLQFVSIILRYRHSQQSNTIAVYDIISTTLLYKINTYYNIIIPHIDKYIIFINNMRADGT